MGGDARALSKRTHECMPEFECESISNMDIRDILRASIKSRRRGTMYSIYCHGKHGLNDSGWNICSMFLQINMPYHVRLIQFQTFCAWQHQRSQRGCPRGRSACVSLRSTRFKPNAAYTPVKTARKTSNFPHRRHRAVQYKTIFVPLVLL